MVTVLVSADVPASELALAAADKPSLIGANALEYQVNAPRWNVGTGIWSETDHTDPDWPSMRVRDRQFHVPSKAAPPSATAYAYLIAPLDPAQPIDCAVIAGHNCRELHSGGCVVTLEISDNDSFLSTPPTYNSATFAIWGSVGTPIKDDKRLVALSSFSVVPPYTPQRYTGASYARVKIYTATGGNFLGAPQLGEVWLGQRRQLRRKGNHPYDDRALRSYVSDAQTKSGAFVRYTKSHGQAASKVNLQLSSADEVSLIRAWYAETGHGTKPTIWIENPNSEPNRALLTYLEDPSLELPRVGWSEWDQTLSLVESAPYFETET